MAITGKYVYVLHHQTLRYDQPATVDLFADALEAIRAAQPLIDETRTRLLTADDHAAGVVFRGHTADQGEVTVTRQLVA